MPGNRGESQHVLAIAINPQTPSIVYEGTEDVGLSSPLMAQDLELLNSAWDPPHVFDLAINPDGDDGSRGDVERVVPKSRLGCGWNRVAPVMTRVVFAPPNPAAAYAINGTEAWERRQRSDLDRRA